MQEVGGLLDTLSIQANSHLRWLNCSGNGDITDAFAATVLLPALRANTSLRQLRTGAASLSLCHAEAIVHARGGGAAGQL